MKDGNRKTEIKKRRKKKFGKNSKNCATLRPPSGGFELAIIDAWRYLKIKKVKERD